MRDSSIFRYSSKLATLQATGHFATSTSQVKDEALSLCSTGYKHLRQLLIFRHSYESSCTKIARKNNQKRYTGCYYLPFYLLVAPCAFQESTVLALAEVVGTLPKMRAPPPRAADRCASFCNIRLTSGSPATSGSTRWSLRESPPRQAEVASLSRIDFSQNRQHREHACAMGRRDAYLSSLRLQPHHLTNLAF